MSRRVVSPAAYRTTVLVAIVALAGIVLTGAAVRLTQSGLGCENWPKCSDTRYVPEWRFHQWTEFGNRLITGLVAVAVAAAVLTAYRRQPRRRDLVWWAWGLVAGVVGQIVLGGVTVRISLHPLLVGSHFLLSLVLLWNAIVLCVRAGGGPGRARAAVAPSVVWHGRAMLVLASAMVFTGTLVTGTGPNSGDARAQRLGFQLTEIARVHSASVWCFTIVTLGLALRLWRQPSAVPQQAWRLARWLLAAVVVQGAVGYVQYALGVPPSIVEVHILGAVVVWSLTILLYLELFDRGQADGDLPAGPEPGRRSESAPDLGVGADGESKIDPVGAADDGRVLTQ